MNCKKKLISNLWLFNLKISGVKDVHLHQDFQTLINTFLGYIGFMPSLGNNVNKSNLQLNSNGIMPLRSGYTCNVIKQKVPYIHTFCFIRTSCEKGFIASYCHGLLHICNVFTNILLHWKAFVMPISVVTPRSLTKNQKKNACNNK